MKLFPDIKDFLAKKLNQNQLKNTERVLLEIKAYRTKFENSSLKDLKDRISEIKSDLTKVSGKIPFEEKFSVKKIDRTKPLSSFEIELQKKLFDYLPEIYAIIDAVYFKKFAKRYYDVQLKAAIILAQGQRLVEQYTGEGKTMTFQLPLFLYSLAGRGAHLVTVNDYLAKVGGEYAGFIAFELGLSVGVNCPESTYIFSPATQDLATNINIDKLEGENLKVCSKKETYSADIVYTTNTELGFDYLRENMINSLEKSIIPELFFCIIDEADSVLIDEARVPLIISASPSESNTDQYVKFANAVKNLKDEIDFAVDYKVHSVVLTEEGINKVEIFLEIDNIWDDYLNAFHLEKALLAKALYTSNKEYIVRNGEILIVDNFTGRILDGRRFADGLHQAIEAKENVEVKLESKPFATITFQNLFRLYKYICGGSGTIMTEAEEFYKIYGLETVVIPTNKPNIRIDYPDRLYKTSNAKFRAVIEEVKTEHEKGRPILIGTASVETSEIISNLLDKERIEHQVLNAKFHEQESRIVTNAGKKYAVTVATNMAGRGTDIVIGGGERGDNAWQEVKELGGLYVIGTERHDSRRIDNQLRGRTGRQGEPGSSRFFISLEDTAFKILGGDFIKKLFSFANIPEDQAIEQRMITRQITVVQKTLESNNFDRRKNVVDFDDVMSKHREIFYQRRRNLLNLALLAEGKFFIGRNIFNNQNINLSIEEKTHYSKKIDDSKDKLVNLTLQSAEIVINSLLDQIFNSEKEISIEGKLKKIDNLISFDEISSITVENVWTIKEKLKELVLKAEFLELEKYLLDIFKTKIEKFGEEKFKLIKLIILDSMDQKWVSHLEVIKSADESVKLQGYANRDPLVEFKNKAFQLFEAFIYSLNLEIFKKILTVSHLIPEKENITSNNSADITDILDGDREFTEKKSRISNAIEKLQKNIQKRESGVILQQKNLTKKFNRNEKVDVIYNDGRILENVKLKKVIDDINSGIAKVKN